MKRLLPLLAFAATAHAATFLVPADRDLVAGAKAIVVATAGESFGRRAPGGWLETVTALRVDEAIKGPLAAGETVPVVELGGVVGSTHYAVPGSPQYAPGERVLLFLDKNDRGDWISKAMAVGKFTLRGDLAVRAPLDGWNYDGSAHVEPARASEAFLQFVRDVVHDRPAKEDYVVTAVHADAVAADAVAPSTYCLMWNGAQGNLGMRWKTFPAAVVFLSHGTQPGATNGGLTALQRGLAAWTGDGASNIVYSYGGTTSATAAGFSGNNGDGINGIFFNDPSNEIAGSFSGKNGDVLAVGGGWFDDSSPASTHVFGSERFYTLYEADVVVQDGIFGAGLTGNGFDHTLTHELGHTLGLRHSDDPPPGGTTSSTAIMASSVSFNSDPYGSTLQDWDRAAIAALYGTAAVSCNPPQITGQPQSVTLNGAPVTLTISAIGDAPLQYQWYIGARGNTATPVGGNNASLTIQPATTTVYWCRISNGCESPVDSAAATVTVNGCPAVTVDSVSADATIVQGTTVTLTASATGATQFQWYSGTTGNTSAPLAGKTTASISITPQTTGSFWVRASNGCGAFSDSPAVLVAVVPCQQPAIAVQPSGAAVLAGSSATLFAGLTGSQPLTFIWYEGVRGDVSRPVINGSGAQLITPPLFAPTTYWVRVSNLCGSVDSNAANVDVVQSCTAPSITAQPRNTAVPSGTTATLTVTATGTALTYQWYQGALFDFTHPLGGSAPALVTPPITAPAQFWVRINSACGTLDSAVATVTVMSGGKRRAAGR